MNNQNKLLIMILESLIKDMDEQSMMDRNFITALKLEEITWQEFMDYWKARGSSNGLIPNAKEPKKAS